MYFNVIIQNYTLNQLHNLPILDLLIGCKNFKGFGFLDENNSLNHTVKCVSLILSWNGTVEYSSKLSSVSLKLKVQLIMKITFEQRREQTSQTSCAHFYCSWV